MQKYKDEINKRYGKLTVLKRVGNDNKGCATWLCKCDCGRNCIVLGYRLRNGATKSCGCIKGKNNLNDLTGQKFGKLTVIERAKNRGKVIYWLCKCECGGIIEVQSAHLKNGNTKSCGCMKGNKKHNMSHTRIYKIWKEMRNRCNNKKTNVYKWYGGRGISICSEWDNFNNFQTWAIQNGYNNNLTIDRIDVNGNYEPSNCRWATRKEQANNTTRSIKITINNETHTITEWAKIYNIPAKMIFTRIKRGWDKEEAIITPKLRMERFKQCGKQ